MKRKLLLFLIFLFIFPLIALAEYRPLSSGDTGDAVRQLQERLTAIGLNVGKADGIYGRQTAAAVEEAQRLLAAAGYDIEQTGTADAATLEYLFAEGAPNDALRTLRRGSKSPRVTEAQNRLIDLNFLTGYADGAYGQATEAAVAAFQQRLNELGASVLAADGVLTPDWQALLMSDLSVYGLAAPIYFDDSAPLSLTDDYLYARSCILMDAPTGEVLYARNADERRAPASTTKIMTLLLAAENGHLDETITIPASAADVPKDSSLVPVTVGERMRMRDLLYGLMLRSGNDAANAVAELVGGSVEAFVARMNARAVQLGMLGTHFVNPHGYHDEEHYSTARDLAILARQGLTDPTFCQIVTCLQYTLPATNKRGELALKNPYELFDPASPYFIEGAAGVKSGYTSHAGFCYVGAAQRDGRTLIGVVLGESSRNRAWTDLRRLFAYGFASE